MIKDEQKNNQTPEIDEKKGGFTEKENLVEPVEVISLDEVNDEEESPELNEDLRLLEEAEEEEYEEEIGRYTDDAGIRDALIDRQEMNIDRDSLHEKLEEHHATTPTLSGGDVDAAWEDADVGEETAGGMSPTPDQDRVDEIGEAFGIIYEDDEPLHTEEKLSERDKKRWELDPDSE